MVEAGKAGVPLVVVGRFGGDQVALGGQSAPLAELCGIFRSSFAAAIE
jgi:phosphoribosylformylglycinamidine synthase